MENGIAAIAPADLAEDTPAQAEADYRAHVRTFNRFVNLVKWFCVHVALMLVGLYVIVMQENRWGFLFIVAAAVLPMWGLFVDPNRP